MKKENENVFSPFSESKSPEMDLEIYNNAEHIHRMGGNALEYLEDHPFCDQELEEQIIELLIPVPRYTLEEKLQLKDQELKEKQKNNPQDQSCKIDDPDCLSCGA